MAGTPHVVIVNDRAVEREDEVLAPDAVEVVADFRTLPAFHQLD